MRCLGLTESGGSENPSVPQFVTQKSEIRTALQQRLKKGETW